MHKNEYQMIYKKDLYQAFIICIGEMEEDGRKEEGNCTYSFGAESSLENVHNSGFKLG